VIAEQRGCIRWKENLCTIAGAAYELEGVGSGQYSCFSRRNDRRYSPSDKCRRKSLVGVRKSQWERDES
jgi:hypothetical protein